MHFQGLNLNLLVSLDALLSERSVTRAAERLHVTQPAMSASLQQLRQYLSDPLLEKVGRRFELTPRAKDLAVSVKDLLLRIEMTLHAGQSFDPATAVRTFKVAMSAHMADLLGVPIIKQIIATAPNVTFQVVDLAIDSFRRVEDGELDYCISVGDKVESNPPNRPEILSSRHLFSDEFVLVASAHNDSVHENLSYEEFCELSYIEVRFSGNFMSVPDIELQRQPRRPRVQAWMPTSQNVLAAVTATNAVAIVPSRLFNLHQKVLSLKSVKPPLNLPTIHQKCFWHARNAVDVGHQWFGDLLEATARAS